MDGSGDEGEVVLEVSWEGKREGTFVGVDVWLGDLMQVCRAALRRRIWVSSMYHRVK